MKNLIMAVAIIFTACTNQIKTDHNNNGRNQENTSAVLQLNDGRKWKTDDATRRNVAAMAKLVKDAGYTDAAKSKEFVIRLQGKIDTVIKECRMTGADHDALHVWLENVQKDLNEVKKDKEDSYINTYGALKKDILSFYTFFE